MLVYIPLVEAKDRAKVFENLFFAYLTDVESTGLFIKNMLTHNRFLIGTFNQIYSFYHFWNKYLLCKSNI